MKVIVEIIQKPLPFPAVSICNSDHLDLEVAYQLEKMIMRNFDNQTQSSHSNSTRQRQILEFLREYQRFQDYAITFLYWNSDHSSVNNVEYLSRIGLTANLGFNYSSMAGVRLKDLVMYCRFLNIHDCNLTSFFKPFFDPYYFNCYTFDAEAIIKSRTTRMFGVENGLTLMLFTDSAGHIRLPEPDSINKSSDFLLPGIQEPDPTLASGRGIRVIVHTPGRPIYMVSMFAYARGIIFSE